MDDYKKFGVGLIKSITYEGDKLRGVIETVNDQDSPLLPFVIERPGEFLEEGKMVKFVKTGSIVMRAIDITKL